VVINVTRDTSVVSVECSVKDDNDDDNNGDVDILCGVAGRNGLKWWNDFGLILLGSRPQE
jgi:hypothetical protein